MIILLTDMNHLSRFSETLVRDVLRMSFGKGLLSYLCYLHHSFVVASTALARGYSRIYVIFIIHSMLHPLLWQGATLVSMLCSSFIRCCIHCFGKGLLSYLCYLHHSFHVASTALARGYSRIYVIFIIHSLLHPLLWQGATLVSMLCSSFIRCCVHCFGKGLLSYLCYLHHSFDVASTALARGYSRIYVMFIIHSMLHPLLWQGATLVSMLSSSFIRCCIHCFGKGLLSYLCYVHHSFVVASTALARGYSRIYVMFIIHSMLHPLLWQGATLVSMLCSSFIRCCIHCFGKGLLSYLCYVHHSFHVASTALARGYSRIYVMFIIHSMLHPLLWQGATLVSMLCSSFIPCCIHCFGKGLLSYLCYLHRSFDVASTALARGYSRIYVMFIIHSMLHPLLWQGATLVSMLSSSFIRCCIHCFGKGLLSYLCYLHHSFDVASTALARGYSRIYVMFIIHSMLHPLLWQGATLVSMLCSSFIRCCIHCFGKGLLSYLCYVHHSFDVASTALARGYSRIYVMFIIHSLLHPLLWQGATLVSMLSSSFIRCCIHCFGKGILSYLCYLHHSFVVASTALARGYSRIYVIFIIHSLLRPLLWQGATLVSMLCSSFIRCCIHCFGKGLLSYLCYVHHSFSVASTALARGYSRIYVMFIIHSMLHPLLWQGATLVSMLCSSFIRCCIHCFGKGLLSYLCYVHHSFSVASTALARGYSRIYVMFIIHSMLHPLLWQGATLVSMLCSSFIQCCVHCFGKGLLSYLCYVHHSFDVASTALARGYSRIYVMFIIHSMLHPLLWQGATLVSMLCSSFIRCCIHCFGKGLLSYLCYVHHSFSVASTALARGYSCGAR